MSNKNVIVPRRGRIAVVLTVLTAIFCVITAICYWFLRTECPSTEQAWCESLSQQSIGKALDTCSELFDCGEPVLRKEFMRRYVSAERPEDIEKVRIAASVWANPETQAVILEQDVSASRKLREAGLTALEFTNAIAAVELFLLRSRVVETKEVLQDELERARDFIAALKRSEISGPALGQWQMIAAQELKLEQQLRAFDMPESIVEMIEPYIRKAEETLTGDIQGDWMSAGTAAEMDRGDFRRFRERQERISAEESTN